MLTLREIALSKGLYKVIPSVERPTIRGSWTPERALLGLSVKFARFVKAEINWDKHLLF